MDHFLITGGQTLEGEVRASGAKNAALPMLCGALLTDQECLYKDVPEISDVQVLLEIFEEIGVDVAWDKQEKTVRLRAKEVDLGALCASVKVKKFRASILILGPILSRFGSCELLRPGGCVLGARSLDIHLEGLRCLGAEVSEETESVRAVYVRKQFKSSRLLLSEASVTGTENLALFLAGKHERAEIFFAAAEPHVCAVLQMLQTMGVQIEGIGTHHLIITGPENLSGGTFTIPPDGLLVGAYAIAGILTGGKITIQNVNHKELFSFYGALKRIGVSFDMEENSLVVYPPTKLRAIPKLMTAIYPGFPTDMQSPFGVLLTQCEGESMIFETLFENRLTYLMELEKMGADIEIQNQHQAKIGGKTPLVGTQVQSWDLRAGAAMVLAGLVAEGTTKVTNINYIDRGYENFEQNLQSLGAKIERVEE